jgi:hypothetical protein
LNPEIIPKMASPAHLDRIVRDTRVRVLHSAHSVWQRRESSMIVIGRILSPRLSLPRRRARPEPRLPPFTEHPDLCFLARVQSLRAWQRLALQPVAADGPTCACYKHFHHNLAVNRDCPDGTGITHSAAGKRDDRALSPIFVLSPRAVSGCNCALTFALN